MHNEFAFNNRFRDKSQPPLKSDISVGQLELHSPGKYHSSFFYSPRTKSQERQCLTTQKYEVNFYQPQPIDLKYSNTARTFTEVPISNTVPQRFRSTFTTGFSGNPQIIYGERNLYEPLTEISQMRPRGREKGEAYYKALQDLGGVEDTISSIFVQYIHKIGMEDDLLKNEIRAIEAKQRVCGFVPYSTGAASYEAYKRNPMQQRTNRFTETNQFASYNRMVPPPIPNNLNTSVASNANLSKYSPENDKEYSGYRMSREFKPSFTPYPSQNSYYYHNNPPHFN